LPIRRGRATAGLLAHVLTATKFCDHLPLYRQSEIYARAGVALERSTLADWVGQVSALLRPLIDALERHVMTGDRLYADDTPVPVLAPGNGKTKTGRLWSYLRDERPHGGTTPPAVRYRYSVDRQGEHPRAHLASFRGVLQADGYSGFDGLYSSGVICEAACWAHVRRKFYDIHAATRQSPLAAEALRRIGELYAIEERIIGKPPDVRRQVRQAEAKPLVKALKRLVHHDAPARLRQKRHRRRDPLCAVAPGGADPLGRRRHLGDRQQRRRARDQTARALTQELVVRRIGCGRRAGRRNLQPDRNREAERLRPRSLSAPRSRANRRSPGQPRCRAAALEYRQTSARRRSLIRQVKHHCRAPGRTLTILQR
jgi:hypothetical protein